MLDTPDNGDESLDLPINEYTLTVNAKAAEVLLQRITGNCYTQRVSEGDQQVARPRTGNKPKDIREATVAEVSAVGSTAVSVNKIAARAGLSVGTLYRHHKTKDDLLFAVFLAAKRDIHRTMMDAAAHHQRPAARLRAMWFALVDYGFMFPNDFFLVELMSAEIREAMRGNTELKQIQSEVLAEIENGIDDGSLVNAPVRTIETILAAPAITLARRASLSGIKVADDEVEGIFSLIWRGIEQNQDAFVQS